MKPILAIVDIDVQAGRDEQTRELLLEMLVNAKDDCLVPLWVNWLRERADFRVVCLVHDLAAFGSFMIDRVRKVPGVRDTCTHLAFEGKIHGDAWDLLPLQDDVWNRRESATLLVKSEPGKDREVFEALASLPVHPHVDVVWVLQLFNGYDADMLMLLLSDRAEALTGFAMSWVRTISGVSDTELSVMLDWKVLGKVEDLIPVLEHFPEPQKSE